MLGIIDIKNSAQFKCSEGQSSEIYSGTLLFKTVAMSIFIILNLPAILYGQRFSIKFEHISLEQGLSQSVVYCILQDSRGFMWFGTDDGLNKYDGYCMIIYRHNLLDSTSICSSKIKSIYEDKNGTLWIGTENDGLNRFDREKGEFTRYREKDGLSNDFIYGILEDDSGNLWISTNRMLSKFS
jgi:two-component system sensor histidine kinase ChiS